MDDRSADDATEDVLLVEYQEIAAYQRHDDSTKWTIVALTFTGAAAAIGWTATTFPYLIGVACLLAAALVCVGARSYEQFQAASRIRLTRSAQIEDRLHMDHHSRIHRHSLDDYDGDLPYPGGFAPNLVRFSKMAAVGLLAIGIASLLVAPVVALFNALQWR
jgi:hypothetical protein